MKIIKRIKKLLNIRNSNYNPMIVKMCDDLIRYHNELKKSREICKNHTLCSQRNIYSFETQKDICLGCTKQPCCKDKIIETT